MKRIVPVLLAAVILAGSFAGSASAAEKQVAEAPSSPSTSKDSYVPWDLLAWVKFLNDNPNGFSIFDAVRQLRDIEETKAEVRSAN